MEQEHGGSISEVKVEPSPDEFELETNRSSPDGDVVEPMDTDMTDDLSESDIPVIAVKAEEEVNSSKDDDSSGDETLDGTSNTRSQVEDPFNQVMDLSKKAGSTSNEATTEESHDEKEDDKDNPWPVMLTPAGPPAFPSAFPVFPGMTTPPVGYMMNPNNLQDLAAYDTYLEDARKRSMQEALESDKSKLRRGRSQKNVAKTPKETTKSGRRKSSRPQKNVDSATEEVRYPPKKGATFKCQHCNRKFKSSVDCKKHEKSHTKYACDECDQTFATKTALSAHRIEHGEDASYECHYCFKIFIGKWKYEKHVQKHGDEAPYRCVICQDRFVDWSGLNAHEKMHEKPYKCLDCDDEYEELRALKKHIRKHTSPVEQSAPPTTYQCVHGECGMEFKKKNQLKRHERESHPPEYLCRHCGKTLKDKSTFEKHEKRHRGEKNFICNYCGKMFVDQAGLRRHERVHTGEKPFKCKICDKGFASSSAVAVHTRTHTGETPFECKFCGKKFSTQSSVYLHLRIHSDTRDFKCTVEGCGKAFRQKAALIMHERRHTGERPFKCKFCNKGFTENRSLIRHERLHTGERPYICKYCGKAVTDQSTLTRHEHSHAEVKRFKCQYCDKRFTWHQHQLIHELLHTGEKPHQCQFCEKRFVKKANLTEHERIHTGEKPYKCKHCDKAFNQRGACRTHEHTHMGTKPYKCKRCDKSFSWQHLLTKHEQTHFDVNAPLEMDDIDDDSGEKPVSVKKVKTPIVNAARSLEKVSPSRSSGESVDTNVHYPLLTQKISPSGAGGESAHYHLPSQKDKDFEQGSSAFGPDGSGLNARCHSLSNTVNALHRSIVTALGQEASAPGMPVMNQSVTTSGPISQNNSGPVTQSDRGVPVDHMSTSRGMLPQRSTAENSNSPYLQNMNKSTHNPIPSYEEVMNLSPEKNIPLPHMPRVMCSPTQMLHQDSALAHSSYHQSDRMGSRVYTQSSQAQRMAVSSPPYVHKAADNMTSPRLPRSPGHEMGLHSISQHHDSMRHQAYIQQQHEHIIGNPAYEQVINNEVEVTASSETSSTLQHISNIMTAYERLETSGSSLNDMPDNSKVIILSVPKP